MIKHGTKFDNTIYEQLCGQRGIGSQASVCEFYPFPENLRVLDVGFGQGDLVRALLNKSNAVYGVDVGLASQTGAIKDGFMDKANLLYLDISHDKLPWYDNFFDFSYCTETIEHLENPAHMFMEVKRTLKHKGRFLISFPMPEDNLGYDCGKHAHMYPGFLLKHSFRMFVNQMYFKILKYRENGSTAWYLLENIKDENQIGIHELIQGNYKENFFDFLKEEAWNDELDPEYKSKTLYKLGLRTDEFIKKKMS